LKNSDLKNVLLCTGGFILSAVLLTIIQVPFNCSWLGWVAIVPFILVCSTDKKKRFLFVSAYLVSAFYWLGNLYWIMPLTWLGWVTFCAYTALLWPLLVIGIRYCRLKKLSLFITVPILIVGAEQLQGLFLSGFHWRLMAHSQYENITLIQIADIFGAGGISFLVAMVNGLVAELIIEANNKKIFRIKNIFKVGLVCMTLAGTLLYGQWRIEQSSESVKEGPLVGAVQ